MTIYSSIMRLTLTVFLLVLLITNVLTLTSTAFNTALSSLVGSAIGIRTVTGMMQSRLSSQDQALKRHQANKLKRTAATKRFGQRLTRRTKRVAAKSIAAIPGEAIPFIGIAVVIADTSYELYAACETVTDLDQLYIELGIDNEMPDDVMHSVCDPVLPEPAQIWDDVMEQVDSWWDELAKAV